MKFDFDKVTVKELNQALEAGRFSPEVHAVLAKVTGKSVDEIGDLKVDEYKKLVANFVKAAYAPVDADPS